ncbi:hypothetical protein [Bacillus seohaeanensis]|uniref:Uncharacterized protein n=1 Tax=Bacillus seohaeanensis TaxID=284580 RepID=A0ABW5RKF2_9BACI
MLKQITSAGLILGLSFGFGGAAFASDEKETSIDLPTQLADEDLMSNEELKVMSKKSDWSSEDCRMTEVELQDRAKDSGRSEEDRTELSLNTSADAQLDSLLDSPSKEHKDDREEGLLNDLLNNLF